MTKRTNADADDVEQDDVDEDITQTRSTFFFEVDDAVEDGDGDDHDDGRRTTAQRKGRCKIAQDNGQFIAMVSLRLPLAKPRAARARPRPPPPSRRRHP